MKIQYVSTYISMSEDGLVEKLLCPVDQSNLFCNQDLEDQIFLYCLECKHKKFIGIALYTKITTAVDLLNDNIN
jgi:hypothetical protein